MLTEINSWGEHNFHSLLLPTNNLKCSWFEIVRLVDQQLILHHIKETVCMFSIVEFLLKVWPLFSESPPTTPEALSCEEGGYAYKEKCYYPSLHDRLTWIQANNKCKQKGLHLSSIQDLDQIEFMINLVLKLTGTRLILWIGLNKMVSRYSYSK